MEVKDTLERMRDISRDAFVAGKVALAQLIQRVDSKIANSINGPEDEI